MSASINVWLYCDAGTECEPSGDGSIGQTDTVREARAVAKAEGWHRTSEGRDICPDCWKAGRR